MAIARRKKIFKMDGAEFTISPLSYDQLEQYSETALRAKEKIDLQSAGIKERLEAVFFVICCALNNADPTAEFPVTPDQLAQEMDDVLAGKLLIEILRFSGLKVPNLEEIERVGAAGETQASS